MGHTLIQRCGCGGGGAGGAFIMTRRPGNGAELFLPSTGPILNVGSGVPFGTFNAWQAIGTPANDFYLTRLQARRETMYQSIGSVLVEFGYGAGPTALEALRSVSNIVDPAPFDDSGYPWIDLNVFNTKVPAGQSLQGRITEAVTGAWRLWVTGWDAAVPAFTPLNVTKPTGIGRYYPSNVSGAGISVACAAYPNYGAWALVVDPAPNDMLVDALVPLGSAGMVTSPGQAVQVGIGPAGAEVAVGTFMTGRGQASTNCDPRPWVKAGERLSLRGSSAAAQNRFILPKVIDL